MTRTAISGEELFKKARAVGQYYGFVPFSALAADARARAVVKGERAPAPPEGLARDERASVVFSLLAQCRNTGVVGTEPLRQPLFLWHTNLAEGRAAPRRVMLQFHAIGSDRALAEAVVIRAVTALAADLYREEPVIRVNSMGDRETRARYLRELSSFFRRRSSAFPEACVAAAKEDAFAAAELAIAQECAELLPAPTEYLSDLSRKRFEELLEHLEATETPYELARSLMSHGPHWNDVCFEIRVGGQPIAWGSRYHELARHAFGQGVPAVGAVLHVESVPGETLVHAAQPKIRFVFVHIGDEAKRLALGLAEDFRGMHLPLIQHVGIESLMEQMRLAQLYEPPYLLVMGRKEALDGTVILRRCATEEESILPLRGLPERLKAVA